MAAADSNTDTPDTTTTTTAAANGFFPHLEHIPAALAPEALLDAVNEGNLQLVRDLIRRDPGLANHRDGFGQTPLMWAAYKGRADMVACLLDCGAGVNECETRRARTALYLACEFDHADVVRLLLQRGADQRLPAQRGWTVLSRGFEGWTPLIIAGYNGCPAVLRCLLAHPDADLDGTDEKGATALWWAAVHNRPEAVRVLLDAGADFLLGNDEGKLPAEAAREKGNHECAALLEAAERAYLMTKSRRLSRESEAWARLLHHDLLASLPPYLRDRVQINCDALPKALPAHAMIHSEEEDLDEDMVEGEEGEAGMLADDLGRSLSLSFSLSRLGGSTGSLKRAGGGGGSKQDGKEGEEGSAASASSGGSGGLGGLGGIGLGLLEKAYVSHTWGAAAEDEENEEEEDEAAETAALGRELSASAAAVTATTTTTTTVTAASPAAFTTSEEEAEMREFASGVWGRAAPHRLMHAATAAATSRTRSRSSSQTSTTTSSSSSGLLMSLVGGGGKTTGGNGKIVMAMARQVPDAGDAEAASAQRVPQAVAGYVLRRMRYDVFVQFAEMLA